MTQVVGTAQERSSTAGSNTITVPAGVTSGMVALFLMTTAQGTADGTALSKSGVTFTQLADAAAVNMRVTIVKATGLTTGDVINISQTTNHTLWTQSYYQDVYDFTTASLAATVRGSSISTCTTGSVTPTSGQTVAVISCERTTATGTTVSSVVSSGGETLTQITYAENTVNTNSSGYIGTFAANAAAARTVTVTYSGASGNGYAAAILTTPIVPPNPGVAVKYTSATDTLATGHLYYTSATDTLATPTEVRPFPSGYTSVTAMLAGGSTSTPFYCAHRGGDVNWPEMSLHAYTQAGYWGVGALEVSLARTSDGVWFGLHDDTLDRTSGVTGVTASAITWATIQSTYTISTALPSGQTAKPYMRLEELVTAYGPSHVLFVDPKVAVGNLSELLTLLSTLYGGNSNLAARVVLKYYGVSGMTIPDAAAARGIKTWGYFYGADSANYTTYAGRWDILGQDYQATAQNWTDLAAAAPSKPLMGHICPNSAAVTTCTGRGAVGAMVSGVTTAITRTP